MLRKSITCSINTFSITRILIGAVFVISGYAKLIEPYEYFFCVIKGYNVFHGVLEPASIILAILLPWIEFIIGVFVFLGLWLRFSLRVMMLTTLMFILLLSQVLFKGVHTSLSGGFSDLFFASLNTAFIMYSGILFLCVFMAIVYDKTSLFGLDGYFVKKEEKS